MFVQIPITILILQKWSWPLGRNLSYVLLVPSLRWVGMHLAMKHMINQNNESQIRGGKLAVLRCQRIWSLDGELDVESSSQILAAMFDFISDPYRKTCCCLNASQLPVNESEKLVTRQFVYVTFPPNHPLQTRSDFFRAPKVFTST